MRFASLALERYGHFDGCDLTFRAGAPDLHIIYGANEAGKTTSLAAVSDLLFGFPARSPYNFLFDYSLLRVGAVLQEDDRTFACRRKKGAGGTLIDAQDAPLDEGPLLAMLRGQTRETFGLSFSLDHQGLRAGGRAMVNARDDAGRALFAAGSGMVGVSEALAKLEREADAIWGSRAAQRRSFTQAEREFISHTKAARDQALKPRTWIEAKATLARTEAVLEDAQGRRDQLQAEVRRDERIRRIAPFVRIRVERLAALVDHAATVDIAPQQLDAAEAAMTEAASAIRAKSAAEQLAREAVERIEKITADPAILAAGKRIDELLAAQSAIDKGLRDMTRLQTDKEVATALVTRLRDEAGSLAADPPSRLVSSKLREIGLAHAEQVAALRQIEESQEDLARRREAIAAKAISGEVRSDLDALAATVDIARALGADVDARCEAARRAADLATTSLNQALARLAPWTGEAQALLALPRLTRIEIDAAQSNLTSLSTELARAEQAAQRSRDEAARLALEMEQLASGAAVSPDDISTARSERELRWIPLREHALAISPLASPEAAVAAFESAMTYADEKSDLRFAAADESSRLSILEYRRAALLLEVKQEEDRAASVRESSTRVRKEWGERLTSAGYPDLDPTSLQGWLSDRDTAEAAAELAEKTALEADATHRRRDKARADLAACLAMEPGLPAGEDIAPLLGFAERIRKAGEDAIQQRKLEQMGLAQLDQEATNLGRRRTRIIEGLEAHAGAWDDLVATLGITLSVTEATAMLDLLDELRTAIADHDELQSRINGISRDARKHWESVDQTAFALEITEGKNGPERLELMRSRLAKARAAAVAGETLQESAAKHVEEAKAADASLAAALESLKPLMDASGAQDIAELSVAIEASRTARAHREAIAKAETEILANGDGYGLEDLIAELDGVDTDSVAARAETRAAQLSALNAEVAAAATAQGEARRAFAVLEAEGGDAVDAAAAAEEARAELAVLAEQYILKRTQVVSLRWAIEQYRERHQDPMLLRASKLFSTLTLGRYAAVRIDSDGSTLRLLGLRDDGRTLVDVGAMSEGTTDQLFLALRIAAVEQSIAAGVRLPFLADDLFVNFDDDRSEAGMRVLAELAQSTQVLFFTHHAHLVSIGRAVVGADLHSECMLA